jgi:hypothetical protein
MPKATVQRKIPLENTVALERHALGTLQYIRASIDAAGLLAVPGSAGIAMGSVGVLAALTVSIPTLAPHWFGIWVAAGIAAFACGSGLIAHQSLRRGAVLYRGPARKFLACLLPPLLAGAALTFELWHDDMVRLIPGTWLLLYGCAVMAAGTLTVPPVSVMGALFAVLGVAALRLPLAFANTLLGVGFGGLHLSFGLWIGWTKRHEY